jgi:hypothetical protein
MEQTSRTTRLIMHGAVPLRRVLREPWFKPIARIGHTGNDLYPLDAADFSKPGQGISALVAKITARRCGELFLFVNDAVLPFPKRQYFTAITTAARPSTSGTSPIVSRCNAVYRRPNSQKSAVNSRLMSRLVTHGK